MLRPSLLACLAVTLVISSGNRVLAQRGQLIEGLFRSIVETEREKLKERELQRQQQADRAARRPLPEDLQPFPTPSLPARPTDLRLDPRRPSAVRTSDQRLLAFREMMDQYALHADALASNLRRQTSQVSGSRELVGGLLHLQAHADALARQAAAENRYQNLVESYSELDGDWRRLSFQLRALRGLSPQVSQNIAALDGYGNQICKLFGLQPQFDRHRMQELMTVATTYMNAVLDDLQLAHIDSRDRQKLIHDGQILEQQLRREAEFARAGDLNEIMPRYIDFVTQWRAYAGQLYRLNDPHIDMRLERIRECGSEVHTLLYMPPTPDVAYLHHVTGRLEREVGQMLDQLTIRALVRLPARERNAIVNDAQQMFSQCRDLNQQVQADDRNLNLTVLQQRLSQIDRQWSSLEPRLVAIDTLDPNAFAGVSRSVREMRDTMGVRESLDRRHAVELAASLEGQAEYLAADIQRYGRYYTPSSFGEEFSGCSVRFLQLARNLNAQLANNADIGQLQTSCQALLTEWEHLSEDSKVLTSHGLSGSRPNRIQGAMRELEPIVAELAAMLVG